MPRFDLLLECDHWDDFSGDEGWIPNRRTCSVCFTSQQVVRYYIGYLDQAALWVWWTEQWSYERGPHPTKKTSIGG